MKISLIAHAAISSLHVMVSAKQIAPTRADLNPVAMERPLCEGQQTHVTARTPEGPCRRFSTNGRGCCYE